MNRKEIEFKKGSARFCVLSHQGHDSQMVAGVTRVVFRRGVAAVGRRAGRRQGLGSRGGGQGPGSKGHVEPIHAAAVHAGLDLV